MGMFDYVQCDARLPIPRESYARAHGNPFQSKSVRAWEMPVFKELAYETGALTITLSSGSELIGPNGLKMSWSGELEFYGNIPKRRKWAEFSAKVEKGNVVEIKTVGRRP